MRFFHARWHATYFKNSTSDCRLHKLTVLGRRGPRMRCACARGGRKQQVHVLTYWGPHGHERADRRKPAQGNRKTPQTLELRLMARN